MMQPVEEKGDIHNDLEKVMSTNRSNPNIISSLKTPNEASLWNSIFGLMGIKVFIKTSLKLDITKVTIIEAHPNQR